MTRLLASRLILVVPVLGAVVVALFMLVGSSPTHGAPPEQPVDGALLFSTQCSSCHGLDGGGVVGRGPTLAPEGEASADFVLRTGRMPLAAPGMQTRRGPVRYSEAEIVALVEHVGTIGNGPGIPDIDITDADVANGGQLYRLSCAACHVASGAGAPIGGGRQAPNLLDASSTEIGEAILVGPGSMPVFGDLEPAEINDIAAYIDTALREPNTTSASRFGGAGPVAEGLAAWILALLPLVALTRWIGQPKDGRDHDLDTGDDLEDLEESGLVST